MSTNHTASRREFLRKSLAGGAFLFTGGAAGNLAVAEPAAAPAAPKAKSRVVVARAPQLRGTGSTVDSSRVLALLDRAMQRLFDQDHPAEAWANVVRPGDTVGLKVN